MLTYPNCLSLNSLRRVTPHIIRNCNLTSRNLFAWLARAQVVITFAFGAKLAKLCIHDIHSHGALTVARYSYVVGV